MWRWCTCDVLAAVKPENSECGHPCMYSGHSEKLQSMLDTVKSVLSEHAWTPKKVVFE